MLCIDFNYEIDHPRYNGCIKGLQGYDHLSQYGI